MTAAFNKPHKNRINLGLIYGSTREGRYCDRVAQWAADQIGARGQFTLDPIDPAILGLPARHEQTKGPAIVELKRRINRADAFIIVTPEYNHGYPAPLKFLIDSVYDEWQAKPVGFVSYGGQSGGIRAVEQLRQVFAELHAVTVRDQVALVNVWEQVDGAGELREPERANRSMTTMLTQLNWWATVLRDARKTTPYAEAVV
jgi:NAD(P)H-dependent FMN reductase